MLRVEQLSKIFPRGVPALEEVSFTLEDGVFAAVLGKSGSGKSTLLRCINRLVEPTAGHIYFRDQEITGASPRRLRAFRGKIGMIFQHFNLVPRALVRTNVLTGRLGYHSPWAGLVNYFSRSEIELARRKLEDMDLGNKMHQLARTLSGGQQQRVGIARALMQQPQLILADEPVSSLDPSSARNIMDILKNINQQEGVTILCNLHSPELARKYAQRILALKAGRLVFDGPPEKLSEESIRTIYETP
ncbi:MAG: phosphonate ABC transporter ATP-binding protein [Nitrospinaceae bacterium]